MEDLNSLIPANSGWLLKQASAINDAGQIAGYGTIHGETHAFLLTPMPEPAGLSLLGLCSVALLGRRRMISAV
jgi:probable HAF family extracellular repeat protein